MWRPDSLRFGKEFGLLFLAPDGRFDIEFGDREGTSNGDTLGKFFFEARLRSDFYKIEIVNNSDNDVYDDIACGGPGFLGSYTCAYRGGQATIRATRPKGISTQHGPCYNGVCPSMTFSTGDIPFIDGTVSEVHMTYAGKGDRVETIKLSIDPKDDNGERVHLEFNFCDHTEMRFRRFTVPFISESPVADPVSDGANTGTAAPSLLEKAMSSAPEQIRALAYCESQCGKAKNSDATFDEALCINTRNTVDCNSSRYRISDPNNTYISTYPQCGIDCELLKNDSSKLGTFAYQRCLCNKHFSGCNNHGLSNPAAQCPARY